MNPIQFLTDLAKSINVDSSALNLSSLNKQSVFDLGYIPTSNGAESDPYLSSFDAIPDFKRKVYFKTENDAFWEMVTTRFTEQHEEKASLHNPLSDTIVVHTSGAAPIQVTIEGYLPAGRDLDTRARFLRKYIQEFNERKHQNKGTFLSCCVRNTTFRLQIDSIILLDSVDTCDYTTVSITGYASNYAVGKEIDYESDEMKELFEYKDTPPPVNVSGVSLRKVL